MQSTEREFWDQRYRTNQTPWDQQGVPPALVAFLQRTAERGRVLIPGCGSGYEVQAFAAHGWEPLAIDFSTAAVERARSVLGPDAVHVRQADFFVDDLGGPFDLIYERAFLCSLPPERWPSHARRMGELLQSGGQLAGIFAYGEDPEPPPYLLGDGAAGRLFDRDFVLADDRAIPPRESPPLFAGKERWQVWRRK